MSDQRSGWLAAPREAFGRPGIEPRWTQANQEAPIRFTFFWPESGRWEGRDYTVAVTQET